MVLRRRLQVQADEARAASDDGDADRRAELWQEANIAAKKKRRLWGNGKGKFRTKGGLSAATVVGTRWLVEDRCNGTLNEVAKGRVRVRQSAAPSSAQGRAYLRALPVNWVSVFTAFLVAHMVGDYLFQTTGRLATSAAD